MKKKNAAKNKKRLPEKVREYLKDIGARGGLMSRRKLTKTQARQMVGVRETKRAARKAGTSLAEINSWQFKIDPPRPVPRRQLPQIRRKPFLSFTQNVLP